MTADQHDTAKEERKARQAAALRDNLHRRKAQSRARRDEETAPPETPLAPDRPPG